MHHNVQEGSKLASLAEVFGDIKERLFEAGLSQEDYDDAVEFLNNLGGVK